MSAPTGNVRSSAQGPRPVAHNPLVTICIHRSQALAAGDVALQVSDLFAHYTVGALALLILNNILQAKYHLFASSQLK